MSNKANEKKVIPKMIHTRFLRKQIGINIIILGNKQTTPVHLHNSKIRFLHKKMNCVYAKREYVKEQYLYL